MTRPCFLGTMDDIDESIYENSLLLVTDVSVTNMIAKIPYYKAKEIISGIEKPISVCYNYALFL